nr:hypothetical protein [Tanacetum cinerariifolium]
GREADGAAHVVAEREEGTAVGAQASVVGDAVHDAAHGVLAHPKPDVAALVVAGLERVLGTFLAGAFQVVVHLLGHVERLLGVPAEELLGFLHVVGAEGAAVGLIGAGQRRAKADDGFHRDNRGLVRHRLG